MRYFLIFLAAITTLRANTTVELLADQPQDQIQTPSAVDSYYQNQYQQKVHATQPELRLPPPNRMETLREAQGGLITPYQPPEGVIEGDAGGYAVDSRAAAGDN